MLALIARTRGANLRNQSASTLSSEWMTVYALDPVVPRLLTAPLGFSLVAHVVVVIALAHAPPERLEEDELDSSTARLLIELDQRALPRELRLEAPASVVDAAGDAESAAWEKNAATTQPSFPTGPVVSPRAFGIKHDTKLGSLDQIAEDIAGNRYGLFRHADWHSPPLTPRGVSDGELGDGAHDNPWLTPSPGGIQTSSVQFGALAGLPNEVGRFTPGPTQGANCVCAAGKLVLDPATPAIAPPNDASANPLPKSPTATSGSTSNASPAPGSSVLARVASSSLAAMRMCFEHAATMKSGHASATIRFVIDRTGVVESVVVSAQGDASVADCIGRAFSAQSFPSGQQKFIGRYLVDASANGPAWLAKGSGGGVGNECTCP